MIMQSLLVIHDTIIVLDVMLVLEADAIKKELQHFNPSRFVD